MCSDKGVELKSKESEESFVICEVALSRAEWHGSEVPKRGKAVVTRVSEIHTRHTTRYGGEFGANLI